MNRNRIISTSLLLAAFAVALANQTGETWLASITLALVTLALLPALTASLHTPGTIALRAGDLALGALTAWIALAVAASHAPAASVDAFWTFALLPAAYLFARNTGPGAMESHYWAVILFCAVAALIVLAQMLPGDRLEWIQRNNFAAVCNAGLLLAAGIVLIASSRRAYATALIAMFVLAAFVGVVGSRGAFLGLGAGFVLLGLGAWRAGSAPSRMLGPATAVLAGLLAAQVLTAGFTLERLGTLAELPEHGVSRLRMWSSALPLLAEHPLTGFGPGLTEHAWSPLRVPEDRTGGFHLHNDYLQFAVEAGWPAGLLLCALPFMAFTRILWPKQGGVLPVAAAAAAASVFVHSAFTFNLQLGSLLIMAGLTFGWAVSNASTIITFRWPMRPLVPMILSLVLVWYSIGLIAWHDRLIPGDFRGGSAEGAGAMIERLEFAVRLRPDEAHGQRVLGTLYTTAHSRLPPGSPGRSVAYENAREHLDKAIEANPLSPWAYMESGRLELDAARTGDSLAAAESDLREALRIRPIFVEARYALAMHLDRQGRHQEKLEVLREGLRYHQFRVPATALYLLETAETARSLGDLATATAARAEFDRLFGTNDAGN